MSGPAYLEVLREHGVSNPEELIPRIEAALWASKMGASISNAERLQPSAAQASKLLTELFPPPPFGALDPGDPEFIGALEIVQAHLKGWPVAKSGPKKGRPVRRDLISFYHAMIEPYILMYKAMPSKTIGVADLRTDFMKLCEAVWLTIYPDSDNNEFPKARQVAMIIDGWIQSNKSGEFLP